MSSKFVQVSGKPQFHFPWKLRNLEFILRPLVVNAILLRETEVFVLDFQECREYYFLQTREIFLVVKVCLRNLLRIYGIFISFIYFLLSSFRFFNFRFETVFLLLISRKCGDWFVSLTETTQSRLSGLSVTVNHVRKFQYARRRLRLMGIPY